MKFRECVLVMVAATVLLPSFALQAGAADVAIKAATKDDLTAAAEAVHKQMAPGGRFEFVSTAERGEVDAKLADMQVMFDRSGSVASMNQESKIRLFNDQESVNAILTKRDSDRRICKSVAPTGSLIPKTSCHTYGEIEKSQRDSQQYMHDNMQVPQQAKGG